MPIQTAQDIYARVHRRAGRMAKRFEDPLLATTEDDEELLEDFLRDGLVELCKDTKRMKAASTIALEEGQAQYPVTIALDAPEKVLLDGEELYHESGAQVRALAEEKEEEGTPEKFGFFGGCLWLYPVPDSSTAGETLRLYYWLNGAISGEEDTDDNTEPLWQD